MVVASEQGESRGRESENRLNKYSYNLSKRLLTNALDGEVQNEVGTRLPDGIITAFYTASIKDRGEFWGQKSFGQQMTEWLHGTPDSKGMVDWLDHQEDPQVKESLHKLGLSQQLSSEAIAAIKTQPEFIRLMNQVNPDGQSQGLDLATLSNQDIALLSFYSKYFTSGQEGTRSLVSHLVDVSVFDNGQLRSYEDAAGILSKMIPFMAVTGVKAPEVFAALAHAEVHAHTAMDKVKAADHTATLNVDEKKVIDYLRGKIDEQEEEDLDIEPLESGKRYPLVDIFTRVEQPKATSDSNPYWINGTLPEEDEFVRRLQEEGKLQQLQRIEPFWMQPDMLTNFKPAQDFKPGANPSSERFAALEALTKNDSGLLALAGVATKTPEEQAKLFQILSAVILKIHEQHPNLLKQFIQKQIDENVISIFYGNEVSRPQLAIRSLMLYEKYGLNPYYQDEEGQREFTTKFQELLSNDSFTREFQEVQRAQIAYLTRPLTDTPDKLFTFSSRSTPDGQSQPILDIDKTVEGWKQRLDGKELQNSVSSGELTPEQIRQLEFLGHAVDVPKLMELLQERATVESLHDTQPDNPESVDSPTAHLLEVGKTVGIAVEFARLTPDATPGHTYWIEEVDAEKVQHLSADGLHQLEQTLPLFTPQVVQDENGGQKTQYLINPDAFKPGSVLRNDERFLNAEGLIGPDAGIFALSAASAKTPEQQEALYKTLAHTIVETHKNNPQLLEGFFKAQTPQSLQAMARYEFGANETELQRNVDVDSQLAQAVIEKFGQRDDTSVEQQKFKREWVLAKTTQRQEILGDITSRPNRLISLKGEVYQDDGVTWGPTEIPVDIPATIATWKKQRIGELSEILNKDHLQLTPEQIRQIEFLSHSVDIDKVMRLLQGQSVFSVRRERPFSPASAATKLETATSTENLVLRDLEPRIEDIVARYTPQFVANRGTYFRALGLGYSPQQQTAMLSMIGLLSQPSPEMTHLLAKDREAWEPSSPHTHLTSNGANEIFYQMPGSEIHQLISLANLQGITKSDIYRMFSKKFMKEAYPYMQNSIIGELTGLGVNLKDPGLLENATHRNAKLSPDVVKALLTSEVLTPIDNTTTLGSSYLDENDVERFGQFINRLPSRFDQLHALVFFFSAYHIKELQEKLSNIKDGKIGQVFPATPIARRICESLLEKGNGELANLFNI